MRDYYELRPSKNGIFIFDFTFELKCVQQWRLKHSQRMQVQMIGRKTCEHVIERVCGCVCEIERDGENLELRELCSP